MSSLCLARKPPIRPGSQHERSWTRTGYIAWILSQAPVYSETGFAVVIDDAVREADMDQFLPHLGGRPVRRVVLIPSLEIALAPNLNRNHSIRRSWNPTRGGSTRCLSRVAVPRMVGALSIPPKSVPRPPRPHYSEGRTRVASRDTEKLPDANSHPRRAKLPVSRSEWATLSRENNRSGVEQWSGSFRNPRFIVQDVPKLSGNMRRRSSAGRAAVS